jgi:hypothetical protein
MSEPSSRRVVLYVRSVEMTSGGPGRTFFHCDTCERHRGFDRLKGSEHLAGRAFPDADWQAISLAQRLQGERDCEVEIIDIAKGLFRRMKLRRQGVRKTPTFVVDGQVLPLITNFDQLTEFLAVGVVPTEGGFRGARHREKRDDVLAEGSDKPPGGAVRP